MEYKSISGSIIIDDWEGDEIIEFWISSTEQKAQSWVRLGERFHISAQKYDTLVFESSLTKTRKIVVNDRIWEKGELVAHLITDPVELAALELSNFKFTGYLKDDLNQIAYVDSSEMILNKIGFYEWEGDFEAAPLKKPTDGNIVPNSINLISVGFKPRGFYRRKRNLERYERANMSLNQILNYFGADYFEKELELEVRYHRDFITYLFTQSAFRSLSEKKAYLAMDKYMFEKVPDFKKIISNNTTDEAKKDKR